MLCLICHPHIIHLQGGIFTLYTTRRFGAQLVELVVVGSWPSSSMRCVPPHVFPATPFAVDAVPGVPNGVSSLLCAVVLVKSCVHGARGSLEFAEAHATAGWRLMGCIRQPCRVCKLPADVVCGHILPCTV